MQDKSLEVEDETPFKNKKKIGPRPMMVHMGGKWEEEVGIALGCIRVSVWSGVQNPPSPSPSPSERESTDTVQKG